VGNNRVVLDCHFFYIYTRVVGALKKRRRRDTLTHSLVKEGYRGWVGFFFREGKNNLKLFRWN